MQNIHRHSALSSLFPKNNFLKFQTFNGMMRSHCGSNTHPDPQQYIQVFRLLTVASLVKPPRGSNVTGGENLKALLSLEDLWTQENKQRRIKCEKQLDVILESQEGDEELEAHLEHTYHLNRTINDAAPNMFGGYVARRARKFAAAASCESCFQSLTQVPEGPPEVEHMIIEALSRG